MKLLNRTTRNVAPTAAGEQLVETLRPAFDDIDARLSALSALRERPSGIVRLTTSRHAAETLLWPVISNFLRDYPDVTVELSIDSALADIVTDRFDGGVRVWRTDCQGHDRGPHGPDLRMAVVGAPEYLESHSKPQTPHDLTGHPCINVRLPTKGGLYAWEFEREGRELHVRVSGPLILNDMSMVLQAASDGLGLACVMQDQAAPYIADGRLVRVLDDWCPPFPGYHLYYPDRRQLPPAFALLVAALRDAVRRRGP